MEALNFVAGPWIVVDVVQLIICIVMHLSVDWLKKVVIHVSKMSMQHGFQMDRDLKGVVSKNGLIAHTILIVVAPLVHVSKWIAFTVNASMSNRLWRHQKYRLWLRRMYLPVHHPLYQQWLHPLHHQKLLLNLLQLCLLLSHLLIHQRHLQFHCRIKALIILMDVAHWISKIVMQVGAVVAKTNVRAVSKTFRLHGYQQAKGRGV